MSIKPANSVPFSALIFDCDGTLVDTSVLHFQALSKALQADGIQVSPLWFHTQTGKTMLDLLQTLKLETAAQFNMEEIIEKAARFYHDGLDELQEVKAVTTIARRYHGVVPMAVASNGQRDIVIASLTKTKLLGLFDVIVTIEDVIEGKPAPEIFLEAARRLNVTPQECVIFEDSKEGLEAAQRANIPAHDVRLGLNF
jgi:HAD superfamily hydrolase (TIGR01509 family)